MVLRITSLILVAFLCHNSLPAQPQSKQMDKKFSDLTDFYKKKSEEKKVVGSSLAMVRDGDVIYHSVYGLTDRDKEKPITKSSIFHWASITKTFTGIAIMQLRDHGLLTLDDRVTEYIPELREVHNEYGNMDEITIRHLMTHSAGFRSPTWPWGGDKTWHPHEPQEWEQLAAMFPYTNIQFKPGSQWSYSNPGIIFLGRIIELITKDDYEYYIEKNILNPLQMHRSYFDKAPYHLLPNLVQSYYLQDDGSYEKARFNLDTGITVSNGGLNAPLPDMLIFLNFLLGNADPKVYRHVLEKPSIEEMFEPQIAIAPDADNRENVSADQMGLTFFATRVNGTDLISHSGSQNGFISHIYLAPEKNMAYAVAYNTMGETRTLDREIKEYIIGNIFTTEEK